MTRVLPCLVAGSGIEVPQFETGLGNLKGDRMATT